MIERAFIEQGIKRVELEEYLAKELERAGFTKSEIVKTPQVTRIIVNVIKPGLAIGKGGSTIRSLTETIATRFSNDNPQIQIKENPIPELDATAMANKVKTLIERGFSWRSIAYKTVKDIEAKGAQGVELILSGKLAGKGGRKRKQRIAVGYMKKVGDQVKLVEFAKVAAYPKPGAIGIKIRIVRPETVFPDKINILEILKQRNEKAQAVKEQQAQIAVQEAVVAVVEEQPKEVVVEQSAEQKTHTVQEHKNDKTEKKDIKEKKVVAKKKEQEEQHDKAQEKHVHKEHKAEHALKTKKEEKLDE